MNKQVWWISPNAKMKPSKMFFESLGFIFTAHYVILPQGWCLETRKAEANRAYLVDTNGCKRGCAYLDALLLYPESPRKPD